MSCVCVVTVCRNALRDLQLTAASVQAQQHADLHYVVIDGASTDGTAQYLHGLGDTVDTWVSEPDGGIYDAMNKGINRCPHDAWVIFLNAGDRFAQPDVLPRIGNMLEGATDIVFGDVAVRADGDLPRVYRAQPHATDKMPGCHQAMLVRSELLRRLRFDSSYKVGADFEFYLRAVRGGARVAIFDGVIAEIAPEGFSATNEGLLQRDYVRAVAQHRGRLRAMLWLFSRRLHRALRRALTEVQAGRNA
jgi:glycosyltransferase involved in cell wall biosynthesis